MKKGLISVALVAILSFTTVGAAEMSEGNLFDVTGGKEIRNVNYANTGVSGDAMAYWDKENSKFMLEAVFTNLPEANGDDFYEGWLVQKSPFKFISTGEITLNSEGKMVNSFESSTDYSSYNFYVLTLEPNDGDPAPADHIVEGTIPVTMKGDSMMSKDEEMMKKDSMMSKDDMSKSDAMMKDKMMKGEDVMMMKKNEMKMKMKANKYYLPIKKLLSRYNEGQLKRIQTNIPKIKEVYMKKTNISEKRRATILGIIETLEGVLSESMEMMMQK